MGKRREASKTRANPVVKNKSGSMQLLSGVRFISAYTRKKRKFKYVWWNFISEDARFDIEFDDN